MRGTLRCPVLAALLVLALCAGASGQAEPVGSEFVVNTYTTSLQAAPAIAHGGDGSFLVVWQSLGQDGSSDGVFGQRFNPRLGSIGSEFRVNSYTTSVQRAPAVALDAAGNGVVVWQSVAQDGDREGVYGQRVDAGGGLVGPEFRVNSYTLGTQRSASVAMAPAGSFVVVWESLGQDGEGYGVFGQRYAAGGTPIGPEFQVNSLTSGEQQYADVAIDDAGNFVVVWGGRDVGHSTGVRAQIFDSAGATLGSEFQVNTYEDSGQTAPSVATNTAGGFVVSWESFGQDGDSYGIFSQRYAAGGAALGPELEVNTHTTLFQRAAAVASDDAGALVIVWESSAQDGDREGIFGQQFDASGAPVDDEFQVNSYTTNRQAAADVVMAEGGSFVVVWQSRYRDGAGDGISAQRFCASAAPAVGNVLHATKRGADVALEFGAAASATWRVHRDVDKRAIGRTAHGPDTFDPLVIDAGAVPLAAGERLFYDVRGVGPCG